MKSTLLVRPAFAALTVAALVFPAFTLRADAQATD